MTREDVVDNKKSMMNQPKNSTKKPYQPPALMRIRLVTEEALAQGCKLQTGTARGALCNRATAGCTLKTRGS